MIYVNPLNVVSPRDCVSNVNVIFDGGEESFSIAEMDWEGTNAVGIRWNVASREWDDSEKLAGKKECKGMPVSRTYPVWFILPAVSGSYIQQIIADEKARLAKPLQSHRQA